MNNNKWITDNVDAMIDEWLINQRDSFFADYIYPYITNLIDHIIYRKDITEFKNDDLKQEIMLKIIDALKTSYDKQRGDAFNFVYTVIYQHLIKNNKHIHRQRQIRYNEVPVSEDEDINDLLDIFCYYHQNNQAKQVDPDLVQYVFTYWLLQSPNTKKNRTMNNIMKLVIDIFYDPSKYPTKHITSSYAGFIQKTLGISREVYRTNFNKIIKINLQLKKDFYSK